MIKEGLIKDRESIEKYSRLIYKEGMRLISLIEDIMRLSQIEESEMIVEEELVDIKEITEEVVFLLHTKAEKYEIQIKLKSDSIVMKVNRNYISELLYNLIDNGIKYNKKGGSIEVNIFKDSDYVNIVVADTGVGISLEDQE